MNAIHSGMNGVGMGKKGVAVLMNEKRYHAITGYKCEFKNFL